MKSYSNTTTSNLIRTRLAVSVINDIKSSFNILIEFNLSNNNNLNNIMNFIAVRRELFISIAFFYNAQIYFEKQDIGTAIGFCNASKVRYYYYYYFFYY